MTTATATKRTARVLVSAEPSPRAPLPRLAEAKLAAPRQRRGLVRRPRIVRTLDVGADAALTLVAAPAGHGKTTAVRAWCESTKGALAWVTLDGEDNDPTRLWFCVATAVDRAHEGLGRRALQRLRVPGLPMEAAVDELLNALAEFGGDLTLVLDDLHTVTNGDCLASIDYAVERLPASARLIAVTRSDPALGLARLRARGALVELRAGELSFTAAEARELLVERGGLRLDDGQIEALRHRTGGWPAVLSLAGLWLRTVDDQRRAVTEFGGNHRYVAEYLRHEVLEGWDAEHRAFLLRAAVLGDFTAELCDAVLGRSDSALILAELEDCNAFVSSLEQGGWFRVHALFAEFATARLASDDPAAVVAIHRRAAGWLRSRGLYVNATVHASAAGDSEVVAELLSECDLTMIHNGRAGTLLRWAQTLPDDRLLEHPELAGTAAVAATIIGHHAFERRRFMQLASRGKAARPERFGLRSDAVLGTVRAAAIDGGVSEAIREGRRAADLAERGAHGVVVVALAALAQALYLGGELDEAWAMALHAVERPEAAHQAPGCALARSTLALVAADRGRLASARTHADQARAIVGRITSSRSWLGAHAAVATGSVLAAEADLPGAEREFDFAEQLLRDELATVQHARVLVRLADVRCRRGRLDEADVTLRQARDEMADLTDSGTVVSSAVEVGRALEQARRRASSVEIMDSPSEAELSVLRLLSTDLSAREIGGALFLSPNTVRSHTRAIYRKLGVGSREAAVARATTLGLLEEALSPGSGVC